jgi:Ca2+-binding RTX toxin-like protein
VLAHPAGKRRVLTWALAIGALLVALIATGPGIGTADAKKIKGTGKAETLTGTKKKDKIKGKGGNDTLVGKQGRDVLSGGSGDDILDAVDNALDKKVNGGSGANTCRIDQADLSIVKGCASIEIPGGGAGGGDGGGDTTGGGGGGLTVISASGLQCGSSAPTCLFTISGSGADALVGTVTGTGGVTAIGPGIQVSIEENGNWTAAGVYGCTGPGGLHVAIGTRTADVPVTCTTA